MSVRGVNDKGEWKFGHSSLDYKTGIDQIKQDIITTLRSWKWDCFFDLEAGIDWKTYLGNMKTEKELKENIIKEISKIDGVVSIDEYDNYLNGNTRELTIAMKIKTIYGNIEILENRI